MAAGASPPGELLLLGSADVRMCGCADVQHTTLILAEPPTYWRSIVRTASRAASTWARVGVDSV